MIAVECLTFAYRADDHPVVVDLDHRFAEAAVTAVTGPSGSGKSTLLYLLGLLLTPQSGAVRFDGSRASEWSDRRRSRFRAREVGFVFQDAALDPTRTVLENVCEPAVYAGVPADVARSRGRTLLERFGVDLPPGRRPGQISGGQAQRVALCRALVAEPQVLLADEPTGNLDAPARDMVFASLRSAAAAGTCVVIATHDPGLVDACDEVLDVAQA